MIGPEEATAQLDVLAEHLHEVLKRLLALEAEVRVLLGRLDLARLERP